jgi:dienelactone hydrolase
LGWCLGGHAVLELARMQVQGVQAMATFHGVFDENVCKELSAPNLQQQYTSCTEFLLCHGTNDPFVSNVENALDTLGKLHCRVSLLQLPAKHGFTNPAQVWNESPAFAYDKESADKAWRQTLALLERRLFTNRRVD